MGSNSVGCTNSSIYPQEFMTPADFLFADVVHPRSSSCLQAFPEGNCSSFLYSAGVMPKRFLKLYVIKAAELKPQRAAMDLI